MNRGCREVHMILLLGVLEPSAAAVEVALEVAVVDEVCEEKLVKDGDRTGVEPDLCGEVREDSGR